MERFVSEIVAVEPLCPSVRQLWLARCHGAALSFRPGQYLLLDERSRTGAPISGAFSLCQPPRADGRFAICVRRRAEEDCAAALFGKRVGHRVTCTGPQGSLVLADRADEDLLLVATGTGIAPFRAMADQLEAVLASHSVWLLQGARKADELLYRAHWEALARARPRLHYLPVVSRPKRGGPWRGTVGRVSDVLARVPLHGKALRAYLCGQPEMVREMASRLKDYGILPADIMVEGAQSC